MHSLDIRPDIEGDIVSGCHIDPECRGFGFCAHQSKQSRNEGQCHGSSTRTCRASLELWNNGDFDKVQTLIADDLVWVHPAFSLTGSEAILNRYRADLAAFPDRRINVTKWVEEGDTVVVEYEFAGTHTGPYSMPDGGELAPTGQRMTVRAVDIFELAMVRRPRTGPTTTSSPP